MVQFKKTQKNLPRGQPSQVLFLFLLVCADFYFLYFVKTVQIECRSVWGDPEGVCRYGERSHRSEDIKKEPAEAGSFLIFVGLRRFQRSALRLNFEPSHSEIRNISYTFSRFRKGKDRSAPPSCPPFGAAF